MDNPAPYHDVCAAPPQDLRLLAQGAIPAETFFRWAAHGSPLCIGAGAWWGWDRYSDYEQIVAAIPFADRLREINRTFMAVRDRMVHRTLLEHGVWWTSDLGSVYWRWRMGP